MYFFYNNNYMHMQQTQ